MLMLEANVEAAVMLLSNSTDWPGLCLPGTVSQMQRKLQLFYVDFHQFDLCHSPTSLMIVQSGVIDVHSVHSVQVSNTG